MESFSLRELIQVKIFHLPTLHILAERLGEIFPDLVSQAILLLRRRHPKVRLLLALRRPMYRPHRHLLHRRHLLIQEHFLLA